ncbi:hypothetical protein [Vibrio cholerae]|uniref:hypothetical protein n=1 Tax=Vibrio cholerae TaxID=666 RepID=UPI00301C4CD8
MKNMFKVDYQGASLLEKNFIKQMLRMASGDVLECVQEECCIVFCTGGKERILECLEAGTLQNCRIEVNECSKHDFSVTEIHDFFERMEKVQEGIKDILHNMVKAL